MSNQSTDVYTIGNAQCLMPSGHHERVDGSAATATSSATFYPGQVVRIFPIDTVAYMKIGTGDATTEDIPFTPDVPEYINLKTETKLTFIGAVVDLTVML